MKLKETIFRVFSPGYGKGLEDGIQNERNRVLKLVYDHAINHNPHPYFVDIIRLIEKGDYERPE
jgi:hypothetical protein